MMNTMVPIFDEISRIVAEHKALPFGMISFDGVYKHSCPQQVRKMWLELLLSISVSEFREIYCGSPICH